MLNRLVAAYQKLAEASSEVDGQRLYAVLEDLRWYAERLRPDRWDKLPKQNIWSFEQIVWYLTRQAEKVVAEQQQQQILRLIDQGKEHVGYIAEGLTLLEQSEES